MVLVVVQRLRQVAGWKAIAGIFLRAMIDGVAAAGLVWVARTSGWIKAPEHLSWIVIPGIVGLSTGSLLRGYLFEASKGVNTISAGPKLIYDPLTEFVNTFIEDSAALYRTSVFQRQLLPALEQAPLNTLIDYCIHYYRRRYQNTGIDFGIITARLNAFRQDIEQSAHGGRAELFDYVLQQQGLPLLKQFVKDHP